MDNTVEKDNGFIEGADLWIGGTFEDMGAEDTLIDAKGW